MEMTVKTVEEGRTRNAVNLRNYGLWHNSTNMFAVLYGC